MCGRLACTLAKEDITSACQYKTSEGKWSKPEWMPSTYGYKPFYNGPPTTNVAVLVNKNHFPTCETDVCLLTMRWGLLPSYIPEGGMKTLHTHNARYETVTQSPLYRPCLANGRRCIVLAEGYYEWQTTPGENNKQPYYLYQESSTKMKKEECEEEIDADLLENIKMESDKEEDDKKDDNKKKDDKKRGDNKEGDNKESDNKEDNNKEDDNKEGNNKEGDNKEGDNKEGDNKEGDNKEGDKNKDDKKENKVGNPWKEKNLIKFAGIFNKTSENGEVKYSCTIITKESDETMSWMHHRMPIILNTEEEIDDWLNYKKLKESEAVDGLLKLKSVKDPAYKVKHYPVEKSYVNKSTFNDKKCMERSSLKRKSSFLTNWLQPKKPKKK